jgi:hypothetical protein
VPQTHVTSLYSTIWVASSSTGHRSSKLLERLDTMSTQPVYTTGVLNRIPQPDQLPVRRCSGIVLLSSSSKKPLNDAAMHSGNPPLLQDMTPAPLSVDRKGPARDAFSNDSACSPSTVKTPSTPTVPDAAQNEVREQRKAEESAPTIAPAPETTAADTPPLHVSQVSQPTETFGLESTREGHLPVYPVPKVSYYRDQGWT